MCALRCHVPLPFDHFFFCFLPPVATGAFRIVSFQSSSLLYCIFLAATYHFVGCVVVLRGGPVAEVVISQVCGAVCPLTDSVSELERSDPST
jgi:hypothetical protein